MRRNIRGPRGLVAAIPLIVLSAAWWLVPGAQQAWSADPAATEKRAPAGDASPAAAQESSVAAAQKSSVAAAPGGKQRAAQLVAAALDAEAQAEPQRRAELLRQALAVATDFSAAHWQLGQVRVDGGWMSVDAAAERARRDENLSEYRKLRAEFGDDAEAHLVLARWCQKRGMPAEGRAHAVRLLELRPDSAEAVKMLGLSWHEGMLVSADQLAQHKARAEKAKQALKYWRPRLEEIRRKIESSSTGDHQDGLRELGAIADSSAIEALEAVFKNRREYADELVQVVGKIPGPEATDWLLRQSLLAKREDVRAAACRQLRDRPPHGYIPKLMGALSTPLQAKVEVVREGDDIRFRQTVKRAGPTANYEKTIETNVTTIVPNPNLGGIVGAVYAQTFQNNKKTEKSLESTNRKLIEFNESIYWVLDRTTDQPLPHQPEPWWTWWQDYNQLTDTPKQTIATNIVQAVDVPYVPYVPPEMLGTSTHHGCFAKGTKVWTLTGPLAIEEIRVGDRVLAQDPLSGELDYKPVLQTTTGHQPMIAIDAGDEQIVATKGHVFWVSGLGWRMAKNLKVGDRLHDVSGWAEIKGLKDVDADETHNLVVADFGTYFVGESRIFVHDITMLQPTTALVPGQAQR